MWFYANACEIYLHILAIKIYVTTSVFHIDFWGLKYMLSMAGTSTKLFRIAQSAGVDRMTCQYLCATWLIQAPLMINQWSGNFSEWMCPHHHLQLSNPINKTAKTIGSNMKRLDWCIHAFTNKSKNNHTYLPNLRKRIEHMCHLPNCLLFPPIRL